MTNKNTRPAAVAGLFYPHEPSLLRDNVEQLLADNPQTGAVPKALIAPHAGYIYSGSVAARAYNLLKPVAEAISRVVLIGPSHRWPVNGLAAPSVEAFATPLGEVPLDRAALDALIELPQVEVSDEAHASEHSLEAQLPFLQVVLADFTLVPLVIGRATPSEVAAVLDRLWGGAETLVVVSSDLSHYHSYDDAQAIDTNTAARIAARTTGLIGEQACGYQSINGLMQTPRSQPLAIHQLDLRNSGDTAGPKRQVVGYGAFALSESQAIRGHVYGS
ncbi:MAG TPA: AmmeMemoRadiSam system protein B [Gammaproteobacteria bacterium]|nr:AmmeMemoRadiSam system protein B [Gammaproteobacteria bacterium]